MTKDLLGQPTRCPVCTRLIHPQKDAQAYELAGKCLSCMQDASKEQAKSIVDKISVQAPPGIPGGALRDSGPPVPSIGQIVHYGRYGSPGGEHKPAPSPAVITEVFENGDCQLFVMNPNGLYFNRSPFSPTPRPGHWSWMPRT